MRTWLVARLRDLAALLLGVLAVYVAYRVSESVCFRLNRAQEGTVRYGGDYLTQGLDYDPLLGVTHASSGRFRSVKYVEDAAVYDVHYTMDQHGRRRVCPAARTEEAQRPFLAFFGGSFAFGEGVEDSACLPAQLAARRPGWAVYNYGVSGHGPQHMLAQLDAGRVKEHVPQRRGAAIYVFIAPHVARAVGSMRVSTSWGRNAPHYVLRDDGALERIGDFTTGRPRRTGYYKWLAKSNTLRYIGVDWPLWLGNGHFKLTARIVEESKRRFEHDFESLGFFVLFYPHVNENKRVRAKMARAFKVHGMAVIDVPPALLEDSQCYIAGDGHPSASGHAIVAEELDEALDAAGLWQEVKEKL